ncbi:MAG: hypothetical protein QXU29_06380 [Candidatus Nitrosocaldus sp.]
MSDASSNASKRMLSIGLAAIIVLSSIVVVLPVQAQQQQVTITASTDEHNNRFFGPSLVRVLITDRSLQGSPPDTINVTVEARRGTTSLGQTTVSVNEIGTSGQFELYVAAHTDANPANPTQSSPSIVRIYSGATGINTSLQSGDVIRITYGGVTKDIRYESSTAALTTDRTTAGDGNRIILRLNDQDANIDPTRVDLIPANNSILIAPTGLTISPTALFKETGQNTGIFELVVGVNTLVDAELAVTTFPSSATFTVQDHDVYARYGDGDVAFSVASITDGDSTADNVTFNLTFSADPGTITASNVSISDYSGTAGAISVGGAGTTRTITFSFQGTDANGFTVTISNIPNPVTLNTVTATLANPVDDAIGAITITDNNNTITYTTTGGGLGKAPYNRSVSTTSTSSQSVSLRNVNGSIDLAAPPTLANGFQIRITDADRNKDTTARDTFSGQVSINNNTLPATLVFRETGDNTGVFVPDLAGDKIEIVPVATTGDLPSGPGVTVIVPGKIVLGTDNKIYVLASAIAEDIDLTITYTDLARDPQGTGTFSIVRKIQHVAGNISTTTPTISVTGRAIIEINDMDLNLNPNGRDFYTVTFTTSNSANEDNSADFRGLADLRIKVRGAGANFSTNNLVIGFEETEPNSGIFRGEVRMNVINTVATLADGDRITFEYIDNTESPTITRSVDVRIGKPSGVIELDRTSYPPSTQITGVGDRTTKIHVVITDPSFNTSSTSQDTLRMGSGDPQGFTGDANNNKIVDSTETITFNNGSLRMQLIKGTTTITLLPGFTGFPTTASEDGVNTGRFTIDIDLPRQIGTTTINDGWQLRFIYKDSNGDEQTVTASIVQNTATITSDKPTYDLGSTITLQIREPDWNNDSDKVDEISINIADLVVDSDKVTDRTLAQIANIPGITLDPSGVLRETGPNTGIFEIKIQNINAELVSRGRNLEFTYTDRTPSGGGLEQEVKLTLLITSPRPDIVFDREVYTPFDRMCIQIVDPGANSDSDRKELLSDVGNARLRIIVGGISKDYTNQFEETAPDSGVFQFRTSPNCVPISDVNASAKPGDGIRVEYRTADRQLELSKTARIAFNDGSVTFDKDSYRPGETARITIEDPDENRNPDVPDQFTIKVISDTDPAGINVTVRETGDRTGRFTVDIILTSDVSSGNRLQVREGDQITAIYTDETLPGAQTITQQLVNRENTTGLRTLQTRDVAATATIGVIIPPTERFAVQQPRTVDQAGNPTTPSVNVPVSIATQIKNNTARAMDYVYIVQVKDANGVVVSLSTVSSTLDAGRTANVSASWMPTAPGTYTIETFVWSELGKPSPLSPLQRITVTAT